MGEYGKVLLHNQVGPDGARVHLGAALGVINREAEMDVAELNIFSDLRFKKTFISVINMSLFHNKSKLYSFNTT